jgi:hypothetical protein
MASSIEAVTAKLEEAIDKVLESTARIAQFSKGEFDEYARLLAPARLGIYVTLQAIYAERPELRPKPPVQSEKESVEPELAEEREADDVQPASDADAAYRAKSLLRDAYRLLAEAREGIRFVRGLPRAPMNSDLPSLAGAADAIQTAIRRLPD